MMLCVILLSNVLQCLHSEIQIILDACKECENFKDIPIKRARKEMLYHEHFALSNWFITYSNFIYTQKTFF